MNIVIIYDVSSKAKELHDKLLEKGYFAKWKYNEKTYHLPANVVWKPDVEITTGISEINIIIKELNQLKVGAETDITLMRCLVLSSFPWDGIEGTEI